MEHQAIQAPEEGSEGFPGSSGGEDEGALTARDHRPAQTLRSGRRVKDGMEPLGRDRMEAGEWFASLLAHSQRRRGFLCRRLGIGMQ